MSKVGCYLLLEHPGLGGISNGMPVTMLARSYNIETCFTHRHFGTYGEYVIGARKASALPIP